MTYISKPVYVVEDAQGWQKKNLEHPAFAWQWEFAKAFDSGNLLNEGYDAWVTDDFSFTTPYGVTTTGREAAWAEVKHTYQFFTAHYHEPEEYIIWETDQGWKLSGRAGVYVNFPVPLEGAAKVKDLKGNDWDFKMHAMFSFEWVKDPSGPNGIRLKKEIVVADGFPMMNQLVKRGMATFDQIAEMLDEKTAGN
jgi:hypothetical protein